MTTLRPSQERATLAALSGFLGDMERRAAVLAELLCGNAERGDEAVAAAMLAFRDALRRPVSDWALQFWRLLLAAGHLQAPPAPAQWPAAFERLARLGPGSRAVLLLRVVGGMDVARSAAVLCVAPDVVARAAQRLGTVADAGFNAAIQQHLLQMPRDRLDRLAAHRARIVGDAPLATPTAWRQVWRRRRTASAAGVVAGALVLAAVLFFEGRVDRPHGARPLPLPSAAPLDTFDADFALMTHRDFDQLAEPGDAALQRDLAFYAWYAAQTAPATDTAAGSQVVSIDTGRPHGTR